jgi:hypothetical protein
MNMIRHDDPRHEFVELSFLFSDADCVRHEARDARVLQPGGAFRGSIEDSVGFDEGSSGCLSSSNFAPFYERTPQAPGQEQVQAIWLNVRQSSAVVEHPEWAGETACPTLRGYDASTSPVWLVS